MATEPLWIIDGDNVAHRRGGGVEYAQVREELVGAVAGHMARGGWDAILVLDGHGRDTAIGRTDVRFAGRETADTVIERMAHRHAQTRDVTVVSSDSVLRHVAEREGVHVMSAAEFVSRLDAGAPAGEPSRPGRIRYQIADALDPEVRAAFERFRRGRDRDP